MRCLWEFGKKLEIKRKMNPALLNWFLDFCGNENFLLNNNETFNEDRKKGGVNGQLKIFTAMPIQNLQKRSASF